MSYLNDTNPVVTFHIREFGDIKVELFPKLAPNTVANFMKYVKENYYNGLTFHRVINGFMIQGGAGEYKFDPIAGEFLQNGFDNPILHKRGVISMARTQNKNSQTSQFFIMHKDSPHLDSAYASFGIVTEGISVVDKIASEETDFMDKPLADIIIDSVSYDLRGYNLKEVIYHSN